MALLAGTVGLLLLSFAAALSQPAAISGPGQNLALLASTSTFKVTYDMGSDQHRTVSDLRIVVIPDTDLSSNYYGYPMDLGSFLYDVGAYQAYSPSNCHPTIGCTQSGELPVDNFKWNVALDTDLKAYLVHQQSNLASDIWKYEVLAESETFQILSTGIDLPTITGLQATYDIEDTLSFTVNFPANSEYATSRFNANQALYFGYARKGDKLILPTAVFAETELLCPMDQSCATAFTYDVTNSVSVQNLERVRFEEGEVDVVIKHGDFGVIFRKTFTFTSRKASATATYPGTAGKLEYGSQITIALTRGTGNLQANMQDLRVCLAKAGTSLPYTVASKNWVPITFFENSPDGCFCTDFSELDPDVWEAGITGDLRIQGMSYDAYLVSRKTQQAYWSANDAVVLQKITTFELVPALGQEIQISNLMVNGKTPVGTPTAVSPLGPLESVSVTFSWTSTNSITQYSFSMLTSCYIDGSIIDLQVVETTSGTATLEITNVYYNSDMHSKHCIVLVTSDHRYIKVTDLTLTPQDWKTDFVAPDTEYAWTGKFNSAAGTIGIQVTKGTVMPVNNDANWAAVVALYPVNYDFTGRSDFFLRWQANACSPTCTINVPISTLAPNYDYEVVAFWFENSGQDFQKQVIRDQKAHVMARSARSVKITGNLPLNDKTWTLELSSELDLNLFGRAFLKAYDQPAVSWTEASQELFDNVGTYRYLSLYDVATGRGYAEWEAQVDSGTSKVTFTMNPNCGSYHDCFAYADFFHPSSSPNLVLGAWLWDDNEQEYMTLAMLIPITIVPGPTVLKLNSDILSLDFLANVPVTIRRGTHDVVEEIKILRIDQVAEANFRDFDLNENVYTEKNVNLDGSLVGAGGPHSVVYGDQSISFFTGSSGATLSLDRMYVYHVEDKLTATFAVGDTLTANRLDFITIVKKGDAYGLPGEIWAYTSSGTQTAGAAAKASGTVEFTFTSFVEGEYLVLFSQGDEYRPTIATAEFKMQYNTPSLYLQPHFVDNGDLLVGSFELGKFYTPKATDKLVFQLAGTTGPEGIAATVPVENPDLRNHGDISWTVNLPAGREYATRLEGTDWSIEDVIALHVGASKAVFSVDKETYYNDEVVTVSWEIPTGVGLAATAKDFVTVLPAGLGTFVGMDGPIKFYTGSLADKANAVKSAKGSFTLQLDANAAGNWELWYVSNDGTAGGSAALGIVAVKVLAEPKPTPSPTPSPTPTPTPTPTPATVTTAPVNTTNTTATETATPTPSATTRVTTPLPTSTSGEVVVTGTPIPTVQLSSTRAVVHMLATICLVALTFLA